MNMYSNPFEDDYAKMTPAQRERLVRLLNILMQGRLQQMTPQEHRVAVAKMMGANMLDPSTN